MLVLVTTICAVVLYGVYRLLKIGSRDNRLPPGPPTIPVLGNLHQIPLSGLGKKFKEWGEQYGGIFSLKFGPSTVIVLFDRKAVHDLLDKKGNIYSDRPHSYVADLVTDSDSFAFMDQTALWRSQRKVAAHNLSPKVLDEKVGFIQDAEANILLSDLVRDPTNFYESIQRTTASVACAVVWGHRGPTFDSFWGSGVYKAMDNYSASLEPGANPPVDEFAFLQYLPEFLAPWKRRARLSCKAMHDIWDEARRQVDARRKKGIKRESIIDSILDGEKHSDVQITADQLNHFLGVLVEGGADTTASSTLTSLMYLALHPEFQEKARKELDEVCGTERLPMLKDMDQCPYINCLVKEAMRIHPVLPLGVPHRVSQDDWFNGMLIPKDSTVILPSWAMHLSKQAGYDDPEVYNPDRFLQWPKFADSYAGSSNYANRDHYGYGAGRRICPGIHLAERTQWRLTSKLLWAFEVQRVIDPETKKPIPIDVTQYHEGIAHCPKPYQIALVPRSQNHIDTLMRTVNEAQDFLRAWDD
ncbi:cytochrome P450 [Teratosphaeria nubilosa]|uniref:Cytochrome P450 n=1 Tax=Teratosphaeria nubilosa TaxID=161662 RepID=A0A6G1L769_9PEZI|nr:cytochrome P450 [Teratosphaeria nubilosa]